jgi:hypothetical protein
MGSHRKSIAHIFLALLDTRRDLCLGGEGFIFAGVDLILTQNRQCRFYAEFFVADFAGCHGCGLRASKGLTDKETAKWAPSPRKIRLKIRSVSGGKHATQVARFFSVGFAVLGRVLMLRKWPRGNRLCGMAAGGEVFFWESLGGSGRCCLCRAKHEKIFPSLSCFRLRAGKKGGEGGNGGRRATANCGGKLGTLTLTLSKGVGLQMAVKGARLCVLSTTARLPCLSPVRHSLKWKEPALLPPYSVVL